MLIKLIVEMVSQYKHITKHSVVHFKLIQCFMLIISVKLEEDIICFKN